MTVFADASALVAFIAGEAERPMIADAIGADPDPLWSPMTCWEAVAALRNSYKMGLEDARNEVEATARYMELRLVRIDREELGVAFDAYSKYGKGSHHPAKLNMGDCFAYACAKTNNARLLYKGNDFIHTDLA